MTIATKPLSLTVNGQPIGPIEVPEGLMMQDFLHEYLNLTGSRMGCGQASAMPARSSSKAKRGRSGRCVAVSPAHTGSPARRW